MELLMWSSRPVAQRVINLFLTCLFVLLGGIKAAEMTPRPYSCGNQITTDRIVGGNLTNIDEFPWMALLRYRHEQTGVEMWGCGGTLVGRKTILTAAHCVEPESLGLHRLSFVRLGEHDINKEIDCSPNEPTDCADPPKDYSIGRIAIHPSRNAQTRTHDVALLILEAEPPYTDFIRPICLPDATFNSTLNSIFVAGWGSTAKNTDTLNPSSIKLYARLNYVNHTICKRHYFSHRFNELESICAGGMNAINACRGDSGGPLMEASKTSRWYAIGVVQLGPKICGIENRSVPPTVFARVSAYLQWIHNNLQ